MKAWEIRDEFGIDNLELADRPEPEPGPGQALVEVRALSLNARDVQVVEGLYDPNLSRPRVLLSDGAGEVVAVGEGVDRFAVGDRVAAPSCRAGPTAPSPRRKRRPPSAAR